MKKNNITFFISAIISLSSVAQPKMYTPFKTIHVGDELGFDYVAADEVNRNVYFSHATKVLVASMDNDSLIGEIPGTMGVHGITFDQGSGRGFISNGKANSITVFGLHDLKLIDTVAVTGINPDAVLYDPYSKKVFAFNGKTNNATVIDAVTLKVIATIPLPGKPEFAVTDLKGKIYVNIEDKNELVEIDASRMTVLKEWAVSPGDEPSGLAIDRKNKLLFSVCSNKQLIVFDLKKERVTDSITIGGRVDAVVFDPVTKMIYSSNGEGNVTVIRQQNRHHYQVVQTLITQKGCKTMALDPKTKKIYLPAAKYEGDTRKILPGSFEILVFK